MYDVEASEKQSLDFVFGWVDGSRRSFIFVQKCKIEKGLVDFLPFVAVETSFLLIRDAETFGMC